MEKAAIEYDKFNKTQEIESDFNREKRVKERRKGVRVERGRVYR